MISIATKTPSGCPEELPRCPKNPSKRPQAIINNVKNPSPCQVHAKSLPDCKIRQRCLPTMVNHNGRLQRPCPSTKGGLVVVRPRRASSINFKDWENIPPGAGGQFFAQGVNNSSRGLGHLGLSKNTFNKTFILKSLPWTDCGNRRKKQRITDVTISPCWLSSDGVK